MRGAVGRTERACRRPGGSNLGAQGRPMSRSGHRLSRDRGRRQGRLGIKLPLDPARFSHIRSVRAGPRPCRRLHRPYRTRHMLPGGFDRDHRCWPLVRRRAGSARCLFGSAHPPRIRLRSVDGDRILFGRSPEPGSQRARTGDRARLRIRRSPRLRSPDHAALYPLVPLQSASRQRPLPGLSRRSNRPAQPDRSGQWTAPGRQRLRAGEIADGARAMRETLPPLVASR